MLDAIGEKLGLVDDLQKCFPNDYKSLLSIAYYLILESDSPLSRFSKWASLHRHPHGVDIPSQRSSELFASLTEEKRYHFFRLQAARRMDNEYWAYDTTSISSYSEAAFRNGLLCTTIRMERTFPPSAAASSSPHSPKINGITFFVCKPRGESKTSIGHTIRLPFPAIRKACSK
uniref:hypothetical protein n=1 Tax=Paenibacillus darwinianus TaxID=1380763 RepID=UPI0011854C70|nr:hypothetical protein [Paenibacillus darwinianus]